MTRRNLVPDDWALAFCRGHPGSGRLRCGRQPSRNARTCSATGSGAIQKAE